MFDKPIGNIKWSEELFKIHSIHKLNVITYKIKDLNDEVIQSIFYEKELQKTKNTTGQYIIEKILKTNKNIIFDSYFDSYGISFIPDIIKNQYPNSKIITNIYRMQSNSSNECGKFCIMFIQSNIKNESDYIKFLLKFEKMIYKYI